MYACHLKVPFKGLNLYTVVNRFLIFFAIYERLTKNLNYIRKFIVEKIKWQFGAYVTIFYTLFNFSVFLDRKNQQILDV